MKLIITEEEKNRIKGLYEQSEPDPDPIVKVAKLDDSSVKSLPKTFIQDVTTALLNDKNLVHKLNTTFNMPKTANPLNFLWSNGITPYLFVVPDYTTGDGFLTTGLSVKINNTPFTINLNLGTNPDQILNSLKFSQVKMSIPIGN
jgi:hypothetical protein